MLQTVRKRGKDREFRAINMGGGDQGHTIKLEKPQSARKMQFQRLACRERREDPGMKIKSQMRSSGNEEPLNAWQHKLYNY